MNRSPKAAITLGLNSPTAYEADSEQQYDRADRRGNHLTANTVERQDTGQEKSRNNSAEQSDDNIAEEPKSPARKDNASKPARNRPNCQHYDDTYGIHWLPPVIDELCCI
jgi:hypothetical protein